MKIYIFPEKYVIIVIKPQLMFLLFYDTIFTKKDDYMMFIITNDEKRYFIYV